MLLPGGEVTVGTPHGTPHRQDNEDLATIRLDPFFIGKYEISQAVWTRVMFDNPSGRSAARKHEDGTFYTWQNPVERVTWHDCLEFCRSLGVVLPTEVQWEHAAKGGSDLLFAYGEDIASLEGRENVRDQAAAEGEPEPPTASWWDGWGMHAPIGSFPANGYGLHDVLGNVSEWCRDRYRRFPEYRDGDGLQVDGSPRELKPDPIPGGVPLEILPDPCVRGGSFYMPIQYTRPAFRNFMAARASHVNFGLRVARAVD